MIFHHFLKPNGKINPHFSPSTTLYKYSSLLNLFPPRPSSAFLSPLFRISFHSFLQTTPNVFLSLGPPQLSILVASLSSFLVSPPPIMEHNSIKKRSRVDLDTESNSDATECKRNRTDSEIKTDKFRVDSAASQFKTSSGSGDVQNDIMNILDDSEAVPDEIQDLDSVIRSFEEEILQSPVPETTSWTGESQPDLGYLLEASDDELGLPPATSLAENNQQNEDVMPSYDAFELPSHDSFGFGFGFGEEYGVANEFMAVGGLFEYPEASDFSEFLWRPESESLPAV